MDKLEIDSSFGSYPVYFRNSKEKFVFAKHDDRSDYVLLADKKVWNLYKSTFPQWESFPKYLVEANEETKTLQEVDRFSRWMIENGCTKSSTILAFGGGVVQDLATFTARNFHRGCFWEFHPSTLLSQADSCIGSKCGINVMPFKNQIGTIYAPKQIVIHPELLHSLELEERLSGFGEILKLSITGIDHFYDDLKQILKNNSFCLPISVDLNHLIFKSLSAKKRIIEADELEQGPRRILNYGHSFGHALESLSQNAIPHGFAIVFGMDLINFLGVKWGYTDEQFYRDFKQILIQIYGQTPMPKGITANSLVNELSTDKKMAYGMMTFAIPRQVGDIALVPRKLDVDLKNLVNYYLENENVFSTT